LGNPEDICTEGEFVDMSNDKSPPGTRASSPELILAWAQRGLDAKDDASSDGDAETTVNVDDEMPPPPPKKVRTSFNHTHSLIRLFLEGSC
jgi:hypothetical protein